MLFVQKRKEVQGRVVSESEERDVTKIYLTSHFRKPCELCACYTRLYFVGVSDVSTVSSSVCRRTVCSKDSSSVTQGGKEITSWFMSFSTFVDDFDRFILSLDSVGLSRSLLRDETL